MVFSVIGFFSIAIGIVLVLQGGFDGIVNLQILAMAHVATLGGVGLLIYGGIRELISVQPGSVTRALPVSRPEKKSPQEPVSAPIARKVSVGEHQLTQLENGSWRILKSDGTPDAEFSGTYFSSGDAKKALEKAGYKID